MTDNYLRANKTIRPDFVRIISAVALEISSKLNEELILKLEDISNLFDRKFSVAMLTKLEQHIVLLNNFRLNVVTPLDFCLHFAYLEMSTLSANPFISNPDELVNMAIPLLHYAVSQYEICRKKYSSIAIASICHVLQEVHSETENEK